MAAGILTPEPPRKWCTRHAQVMRSMEAQYQELHKLRNEARREVSEALKAMNIEVADGTAGALVDYAQEIRKILEPFDKP